MTSRPVRGNASRYWLPTWKTVSIYLFDEWAADQDPAFKRVFYTQLLPELKARGKTVIAITHDDAYFHCADRILKLEDGNVRVLADVGDDVKPVLHAV